MKRNYFVVGLVVLIFFVISFLTNILGPLGPEIIKGYDLSLTMAAFLPFAFFIAYGVMSIPAGVLVEKYKEKAVMVAAFVLASLGAFIFALFPYFPVYTVSLFMIGTGMAMLQVSINPLLRVAGGEENFAFNSVLAQLFFGGASYVAPLVYSYIVLNMRNGADDFLIVTLKSLVPENLQWVSLYWVFGVVSAVMVVVIVFFRLPKVELAEGEKSGSWEDNKKLFKNKTVIAYFFGIFAYVGTEQGISYWMSQFLYEYHGFNPETSGASAVSYFWLLMLFGCLLGLLLLKLWDSRKILVSFSVVSIFLLFISLVGSADMALYGLPTLGFTISIMWSVIFSLGLNSLDKHHGAFSGILCTGIMGGAVVQLVVGGLGDLFGLRFGMMFVLVTLSYILSIGIWSKPLVNNDFILMKDILKKIRVYKEN
ncbi:MAG: MFS transporter [Bacteroidetes bacterium]|nr:MFS transporter [Bacteroidota bacterium]